MFTSADAAKAAAKRLHKELHSLNRAVQLTRCQELIARAAGWRDWRQLRQTVIRPKDSPRATRESLDDVRRRFAELLSADEGLARVDAGALFDAVFRARAEQLAAPDLTERLREIVRAAPVSRSFGHGYNISALEVGEQRKRWLIPLEGSLEIEIVVGTNGETLDTGLPIREFRAYLGDRKKKKELIGFAEGTLFIPRGSGGIEARDAVEIADIVSDNDVWTVLNLTRDHPDIFRAGVAYLPFWEIRPKHRGSGLGRRFLIAMLRELKRHYRPLSIVAADPATAATRVDFAKHPGHALLEKASTQALRRLLEQPDIVAALGPKGRVAVFDNARHASPQGTFAAMAGIYAAGELPETIPDDQTVDERMRMAFGLNALLRGARPPAPARVRPLDLSRLPPGHTIIDMIDGVLDPNPRFHTYMPAEVAKILVAFHAPDITLRRPGLSSAPQFFVFEFRNGTSLTLEASSLGGFMPVGPEQISRLNREQPQSEYAPRYGKGDLMAVLVANTRLLFRIPERLGDWATRPLPAEALVDLDPQNPSCGVNTVQWPSPDVGTTFLATAQAAWEALAPEMLREVCLLAKAALADGRLEREAYDDTWQGLAVVRQRFHKTAWKDPKDLTFKSIGRELSPTMPFAQSSGCEAHETYRERLNTTISKVGRRALEDAVAALPILRPHLQNLIDRRGAAATVDATLFLPGVWRWYSKALYDLLDKFDDLPLVDVAGALKGQAEAR
jgi:hypothetical protein